MLYYLFNYLEKLNFPGARVFHYISFRSSMALITSLLFGLFFGKKIINYLQLKQIGEIVRDLGLEGQLQKKGTPTMGGIIILLSILIPTLLFCDLRNVYVILMIVTTVWLGTIGFIDDYIKVFKKDKEGLHGIFKVIGQVSLGIIVGLTIYFSPQVVVREKINVHKQNPKQEISTVMTSLEKNEIVVTGTDVKKTTTTIPFFKNHEFDYSKLIRWMGGWTKNWIWLVMVIVVIFIVTAVSNGANITDGLDGLASGTSAIIGTMLAIFAYVSGNIIYAKYLNIMYLPNTGELVIFISAFIGATVGFLWYNTYPAQVFMGDTGSLALGGIIGVFSILVRKELLIPIFCGIFLVENISVMIQVGYFKYTKNKYGEGRRIFLMAPLHHHYQKKGYPEAKIVTRFWIIGIILAVITIATLKTR
jgi:phospho-N-acetylmuramoyl-pentapeptide-transferase